MPSGDFVTVLSPPLPLLVKCLHSRVAREGPFSVGNGVGAVGDFGDLFISRLCDVNFYYMVSWQYCAVCAQKDVLLVAGVFLLAFASCRGCSFCRT